jgi:hypothetical protein
MPVSFNSFYIPRVRHIGLHFWCVHSFDAAVFPYLRHFDIDRSDLYFCLRTVGIESVEEAVAVLGGAMYGRFVEEMHKDRTEASKASSN